MGLRIGFIYLLVFITVFAILLQDYQVECRGGRGGGRGGSRGTYRHSGGGGGGDSNGSGSVGAIAWWIYLAFSGVVVAFV